MTPTRTESELLALLRREGLERTPADWPAPLQMIDEAAVSRELARPVAPFSPRRLMAFLSPAAGRLLEPMARAAAAITRQRFGDTMALYAPLYVSNYCINRCVYCGFNASHRHRRRRLTLEEAEAQGRLLAEEGFGDLLLVSGEDPKYVDVDYLRALTRRLTPYFSSVCIEVAQLDEAGYCALAEAGVDGVTLYQETYDRDLYARLHPAGPKADYEKRLAAQETAARAGIRRLGIGALLGLADWRYEALCLGWHAHLLIRRHWRARVAVSFPRMRPAEGVAAESFVRFVGDRELVQMMLALRLCFPDIGLTLSTREPEALRNHLIQLGITQLSAGSRTNPGGYGDTGGGEDATEQFAVADTRTVAEVAAYLKQHGFDPVWKDWDAGFYAGAETTP